MSHQRMSEFAYQIYRNIGPDWSAAEAALSQTAVSLPLYQRSAWAQHHRAGNHGLLTVENATGQILGGVGVQILKSRALPGHRIARVLRFGEGLPPESWQPTIAALVRFAEADKTILRLNVSVFARTHRAEIAGLLQQQGFTKSSNPLSYRHTIIVDLLPDNLLEATDKKARKDLREAEKAGLCIQSLTSDLFADRISALENEAMNRSGGSFRHQNWRSILQLSMQHPELSRVVGAFLSGTQTSPKDLVAFGWSCMHGNHAENRAAGTTRVPNNRLTLSSPVLWDQILWAKREGASWFDLGGVTIADGNEDALAGISSFKRHFGRTIEEVGEDWYLEPHPARARAAAFVGGMARALGQGAAALRGKRIADHAS